MSLLRCDMVFATRGGIKWHPSECRHARLQPGNAAAAHRNHVIASGLHLDHVVVARSSIADDALEIHDVAAMDANEPAAVEPGFDVADPERTKQPVLAVENIGVVRVGVNRDDILDGKEVGAAVALDRKMTGKAPARR